MIHLMIVIQIAIKNQLGMEKTLVITLMKTREKILNRKTTPKVIVRLILLYIISRHIWALASALVPFETENN